MEVLKLHAKYDGWYGGSVDEYILLPIDINGILFEELEVGNYNREVYLGEIEGKHSEVHGDLEVEILNLDDCDILYVSELIKGSNFNDFQCYFEGKEEDWREQLDCDEVDYEESITLILNKYKVEYKEYCNFTDFVHSNFIEELKSKYVANFKTITVHADDYDNAMSILHNSGMETY